ncbi:MAG: hypothetical protein GY861_16000 [bacterium]|nr:hypothetical protein [bacterium]
MITEDAIKVWVDQIHNDIGLTDPEVVENLCISMKDQIEFFCIDCTGIFAYLILPDFKGGTMLTELIFYIIPESRGDIKLVKKYIQRAEKIAVDNGCKSIKIGGNIGYKDQSFTKLLTRWGYLVDTVSKEVGDIDGSDNDSISDSSDSINSSIGSPTGEDSGESS